MVHSAAGAAGALAGWAIASIGKQLPISELHTSMASNAQAAATLQAPAFSGAFASPRSSFGDRPTSQQGGNRPASALGSSKLGGAGMRLGGSTSAAKSGGGSSLVDALAGEFEEDGDEVANAWGQGDLMDVNADADDWSEWSAVACQTGH